MTKVGDTLYRINRYRRQGEEKWSPVAIVGETLMSWLYAPYGESHHERIRINKKHMTTAKDYRGSRDRYFTYEGRVAYDFCETYARDIGGMVSVCKDPEKLRQIAVIIGKEIPA